MVMVSHLSAWFSAVMSPGQDIEKHFPDICAFYICMQAVFSMSSKQSWKEIQVQHTSLSGGPHIENPRWSCPQSLHVKMLQDTKELSPIYHGSFGDKV